MIALIVICGVIAYLVIATVCAAIVLAKTSNDDLALAVFFFWPIGLVVYLCTVGTNSLAKKLNPALKK